MKFLSGLCIGISIAMMYIDYEDWGTLTNGPIVMWLLGICVYFW